MAFRKGVQKNTKRYMLPSKKQEARPRVKMRELVKIRLRTEEEERGASGLREGELALGEVDEVREGTEGDFWVAVALSP